MHQRFVKNVIGARGNEGRKWLQRIPQIIADCEKRWNIVVGEPFTLSYNYVAPAKRASGEDVVIKIGFPTDKEFLSEYAGLKHFNGQGAVEILDEDMDNGVMLLEKIEPGTVLHEYGSDTDQTRIACQILKRLHRSAPTDENLISLFRWRDGYKRYKHRFSLASGPIPQDIFELAEMLDEKHFSTVEGSQMLIHGDFHHDNILSSKRGEWLVIDTKGVVGNPLYDIAVFLYNPMPKLDMLSLPELQNLVKKRLDIVHEELGFERSYVTEWAISKSILSTIWSIEDQAEGWEYGIKFAQILRDLDQTI